MLLYVRVKPCCMHTYLYINMYMHAGSGKLFPFVPYTAYDMHAGHLLDDADCTRKLRCHLLHAGNAAAIAALVYASMTLDVSHQDVVLGVLAGNNETLGLLQGSIAQDTSNTTAHSIQQAILAANLSSQVVAGALGMAIAQSMEDVEDDADPAIIIQAAILVNQTQAVSHAFNMVRFRPTNLLKFRHAQICNGVVFAHARLLMTD